MATKKIWLAALAVVCVAVLVIPLMSADAISQKQEKGKPGGGGGGGNGGGGGGTSMISVVQLTLHDQPGSGLLSDESKRTGPDVDEPVGSGIFDGYWELEQELIETAIVYQDSRISFDDSGIHPDPCSVFDVSTDGSTAGRVRALFDSQNCSVVNPLFANDARTMTLVFDKEDTADPITGGSCACDQFRYLSEVDPATGLATGVAAEMYNGVGAKTSFNEDSGACFVGLAAGEIVTDSDHNFTASQQIIAWPYEEFISTKGKKSSQKVPDKTTVDLNFRTDRVNAGESKNWQLNSQGEDISIIPDDFDSDRRAVISTGQRFDLSLAGTSTAQCTSISLPFTMSFKKFEVDGQ